MVEEGDRNAITTIQYLQKGGSCEQGGNWDSENVLCKRECIYGCEECWLCIEVRWQGVWTRNERAAVAAAFKIYSEVQVVNANAAANYRVQQDAPTPPCQSIRRETPFVIKSNPFYIAIKDIGLSRRAAAALMLGMKGPNWKLRPRIVGMKGLCKAGWQRGFQHRALYHQKGKRKEKKKIKKMHTPTLHR